MALMSIYPTYMWAAPEAYGSTLADSKELLPIYPKPMRTQNPRTRKKR